MAQWKERPAYREVADDLRRRIHEQEFPVGAKLPSHAALMREYGVSVTVVRMALDELGSQGLIRSQQGRGRLCMLGRKQRSLDARRPSSPCRSSST